MKLALAQIRIVGGAREANLARAEWAIASAAREGADIVLLPETLDFGWTHESARAGAGPVPGGESCERLCQAARRAKILVAAGIVERAADRLFNAAVLIGPAGELLLHHRKLNELELAHHLYATGDRLAVATTRFGTIGIMICADGFAHGQSVSRALALMQADLILSPCAWAVPIGHDDAQKPYGGLWLDNYGAVARDHQLWIAGCSNVGWITDGPWRGRPCIGCSLLVGPDGKPILRGPYGPDAETILYANLPIIPAATRRRPAGMTPRQLGAHA